MNNRNELLDSVLTFTNKLINGKKLLWNQLFSLTVGDSWMVMEMYKEVRMYGRFNYAIFSICVSGCYCCSLAEITGRNINTRIHVGGVI